MSKLSESANRLLFYLQKYAPNFARGYNLGIARAEIQSVLNQYELPNDFYELYEWRNGNSQWFNQPVELPSICEFSSLDIILENLKNDDWDWDTEKDSKYKNFSTVPFVDRGGCSFFAVIVGRSYEEEAHIASIHMGGGLSVLRYDSVSSMLESEVSCYEMGAIYPENDEFLTENLSIGAEILRSKNPKTLVESMSDLKNGLNIYGQDENEIDEGNYGNLLSPIFSALATLELLRPPEAIELVQERLSQLGNKSSRRVEPAKYGLSQWLRKVQT